MASSELRARVSLDVSGAERKLNSLIKKIQQVNAAVKGTSSSGGLETKISKITQNASVAESGIKKMAAATAQVEQRTDAVYKNSLKIAQAKEMEQQRSQQELSAIKQRLLAEDQVAREKIKAQQIANRELERQRKKEEQLAAQQEKAAQREKRLAEQNALTQERIANKRRIEEERNAKAAEKAWEKANQKTISSAQKVVNSIKKIAGAFLGIKGVASLGDYIMDSSDTITSAENKLNTINNGDTNATKAQMDKMFTAAQISRSSYADMISNVGKSMTIAPGAFKGNMDNAIRFQEVMAKSYTLAGASASEQSQSMYQLLQGIGAKKLQGDEMKSVMENAPLAYKTIEEYVQGILAANGNVKDATKSLQKLGSEGKVTGEMIVAAMLNAGNEIDSAFEDADMTIGQVFTNIKNTALNAFRSIQDTINEFINSDVGAKLLNGITSAIKGVMAVFNMLAKVAASVITFIVDNWYWMRWIIYAIGIAIVWLAMYAIGKKLYHAVLKIAASGALAWLPWLFAIGLVIAGIVLLANNAKNGCDFIVQLMWWVCIIVIVVMTIIMVYSWITTGGITLSIQLLVLFIIGVIALLIMAIAAFGKEIGEIIGLLVAFIYNEIVGIINAIIQFIWTAFVEPFIGIIEWILNVCNGGFDSFGGAVANLIGNIISWFLSLGKVVTKIIDAIFGTDWTGALESLQNSVLKWGKNENAITLSREAPTINSITNGYLPNRLDYNEAMDFGGSIGAGVQNAINKAYGKVKGGVNNILDKINGGVGTDVPAYNLTSYDPDKLANGVGDTAKNTGKMADSMDMAEEDLDYLRKLADMEWKKEFTTANIVVDMKNTNTINNQGDLDGWLGVLSDKLYEELGMVADGVYA